MKMYRRDRSYPKSILGILEICEMIGLIMLILFLLLFPISIAAIFWELKLSTIFGKRYTSNSWIDTPNGIRKAQTGAAGASAAFGLIGSLLYLIEAIFRFLNVGQLKRHKHNRRRVHTIT
ncbi:unnamed protein product [Didymodactylos carnosus]|uniref:Uncharacterized protein n=1 Tax=Didymodactylos carnosus TaxID=1234261 RepID=A0A813VRU1_9BILA|nr:unnamed protein product [Didymodactylos carnosus]CAF0847195.1 unnamed protein product [Didymodactylos carnosus]CAF3606173.1 unnamed protein product [Didymodactylos carnosus]CAF3634836.1 unnamed protein product [Didymodactylos carnosus]